jgi:L-serine dehydratase
MEVSIFNDVLGPVMRGPSSSHCAAALRIGRLARDLMGGEVAEVLVEFDRAGSLPTTHDTQGSDMGLFGGLMGWEADDERLPDALALFRQGGGLARFETVDVGDPHPNTYRLTLRNARATHFLRAISTGGGMMEVVEIDGIDVSLHGDAHVTLLEVQAAPDDLREEVLRVDHEGSAWFVTAGRSLLAVHGRRFLPAATLAAWRQAGWIARAWHLGPVLPVPTVRSSRVPYRSCAEMLATPEAATEPLWRLAARYEQERGGLTESEVLARAVGLVRLLRRSIEQGLAGTTYADRVLGSQSPAFAQAMRSGRLIAADPLNRAILYVTALMEVKSSMGVIVAMPTAGACAALPGIVLAVAEERGLDDETAAKALLASGVIGAFIATRWTFAAEVGGCQAEGGSAAAMGAAALVDLAGGSATQACAAASLALQSMLGLICDPIANRVEAPCLGKNVLAATNALACANMALAGFDQVIPFDEVVDAAKAVAERMPREHRCTALGGLSDTPTSRSIEKRLAAARGCGSGGCGCG